MKRAVFLLLLIFPACLRANDFGITLTQDAGLEGIGRDTEFEYAGGIIPSYSTSFGDSGDLYVSAWLKVVYEYERTYFTGEFLHTEFSWRINNFNISAGRIPYSAPLDFLAEGFFDGVQVSYETGIGSFYAGSWYTGMLYKKSANITMTVEDIFSYYTPLDYSDFFDTYFASRRVLMAVGWDKPDIAEMIRLKAAVLGQIDLNNADTHYNSMYAVVKAAIPFKLLRLSLGGCFQFAKDGGDTEIGWAGEFGSYWIMPTSFYSQLSLLGRYSSGNGKIMDPFVPITTKPQGNVLQAKLSGVSSVYMDYTAKLRQTLSAGLSASTYIRNDKETYTDYPVNSDSGSILGCEFFGRALWNPLTDLSVNIGAGFFLPMTDGMKFRAADTKWRVELGLSLVVY